MPSQRKPAKPTGNVTLGTANYSGANLPKTSTLGEVTQSKGSQIASGLNSLIKTATDTYKAQANAKVEADKVRQATRQANGQSHDAETQAGYNAYKTLEGSNAVSTMMRDAQDYAQTLNWLDPDAGAQEELENFLAVGAQNITAEYAGDNEEIANAIGGMISKSLPNTYAQVAEIRKKDLVKRRHDGMMTRYLRVDFDGTSPSGILDNLQEVYNNDNIFLGASEDERDMALKDAAIYNATQAQPNTLLLDAAFALGLDKKYPGLSKARQFANNVLSSEAQGQIAMTKDEVEGRYALMPLTQQTKDSFYKEVSTLRDAGGKLMYSEKEMRSVWNGIMRDRMKEDDSVALYQYGIAAMNDTTMDPPSYLYGSKTKKERKSIYSHMDAVHGTAIKRILEEGGSQEDLNAKYAEQHKERVEFAIRTGWLDPQFEDTVKGLMTPTFDRLESPDGKLLTGIKGKMEEVAAYVDDPSILFQYEGGEEAYTLYRNYQANLQSMNELNAMKTAVTQSRGNKNIPAEERTKLTEKATSKIKSEFTYVFSSNVAKGFRRQMSSEVLNRAMSLYGANRGNMSEEDAIGVAIEEYKAVHTEIDSGMWVRGSAEQIASAMSGPNKQGKKVHKENVSGIISSAPELISEGNFTEGSGFEGVVINRNVPFEEWIPVIDRQGNIKYVDEWQSPVTINMPLYTLSGVTVSERIKQEEQAKKEKEEKYMIMKTHGLNSKYGAPNYNWNQNQ